MDTDQQIEELKTAHAAALQAAANDKLIAVAIERERADVAIAKAQLDFKLDEARTADLEEKISVYKSFVGLINQSEELRQLIADRLQVVHRL